MTLMDVVIEKTIEKAMEKTLEKNLNEKTINGIRVNCYDRGSGQAVLFLHGWGSDFSSFRRFLDGLSESRRACALDLPGFGRSDEPPAGWSVDDYADFVLEFLKELGIKSVVPIGHSFGGRVVVKLAARKNLPVTITKAVLVDGAGIRPKRTLVQKFRAIVYKAVRRLLSFGPIWKAVPSLLERWRDKNASADYRNATPRMRECLVKAVGEDLTPCLTSIRCPTLLIWGENDTATPLSDAKTMEKMIPGSGLVVLKNAGHYSFVDQPYVFGKVLDSFLEIERT